MSDGARLTIKDARFNALRRVRPRLTRELTAAVVKAAEEHEALSKTLAPRDEGDLAASIKSEAVITGVNPSAKVVAGEDEMPAKARWAEFGTAPRPQKGQFEGTMHPGTAATPFMFPAYRLLRKRAVSRIGRAIRTALRTARPK